MKTPTQSKKVDFLLKVGVVTKFTLLKVDFVPIGSGEILLKVGVVTNFTLFKIDFVTIGGGEIHFRIWDEKTSHVVATLW